MGFFLLCKKCNIMNIYAIAFLLCSNTMNGYLCLHHNPYSPKTSWIVIWHIHQMAQKILISSHYQIEKKMHLLARSGKKSHRYLIKNIKSIFCRQNNNNNKIKLSSTQQTLNIHPVLPWISSFPAAIIQRAESLILSLCLHLFIAFFFFFFCIYKTCERKCKNNLFS